MLILPIINETLEFLNNTVTQPIPNVANEVLEKLIMTVPLKHLINFCRSPEILLITCKIHRNLNEKSIVSY